MTLLRRSVDSLIFNLWIIALVLSVKMTPLASTTSRGSGLDVRMVTFPTIFP